MAKISDALMTMKETVSKQIFVMAATRQILKITVFQCQRKELGHHQFI